MFEYNTERDDIRLREYGRNIQKIIKYIKKQEDKEKRTKLVYSLVELVRQVNPDIRENSPEIRKKIWDDIYIMSEFDLDVDGEFPPPEKSAIGKKPKKVPYLSNKVTYRQYGHNIELLIEKVNEMPDGEEKEQAIIHLGKLMKGFYAAWNNDTLDDAVIIEQIKKLSKGNLSISEDKVREDNLFKMDPKLAKSLSQNNNNNNKGGKGRRKGKRNYSRRRN